MTKEEKSEIKYRMKRLARKFCRRNNVYESFDDSVGELIEKGYFSAYLLCLHENKNRIAELEEQIKKMKSALIDIKSNTNDVNIEWQIKYLFDELEIKENE